MTRNLHVLAARSLTVSSLLLFLASCREGESQKPIPLTDLLPVAEVLTETVGMDAALPETTTCLTAGWGSSEQNRLGAFVWSIGDKSQIEAFILRPRPLTIRLTGWPLSYKNAPPQRVEVRLNENPVGGFTMRNGWQAEDYAVDLPAEYQVFGKNKVELVYSRTTAPAEVAPTSQDQRLLSAAWSRIVFDGIRPADPVEAETDGDTSAFVLPSGSALAFYLWLPQGGRLRATDLQLYNESEKALAEDLYLQITTRVAGAGAAQQQFEMRQGETLKMNLPASPEGPIQILLTTSTSTRASSGGLRLVEPQIYPATLPEPSTQQVRTERPRRRPNVLVYLVDTLRADHLGTYGYDLPTSPNIDAFAENATLFTTTIAQASWTRSAVASLFTGLYPQTHGTNDREDALPESVPILPEFFHNLGYETISVIGNGNVSKDFGFARGVESYQVFQEDLESREVHNLSDYLNKVTFALLRNRSTDRPFFLYVHTADPHDPYAPKPPYRSRWAPQVQDPDLGSLTMMESLTSGKIESNEKMLTDLKGLYDAEISFNDAHFGALLAELDRLGIADSTIVVFLSDHGEEFMDHGSWKHGRTLFSEQLRVPLIIKFTDDVGAGLRVSEAAQQIDILPTLLDFLGEEIPQHIQGRSLLPFVTKDEAAPQAIAVEPLYAYLSLNDRHIEAVTFAGRKLIDYISMPAYSTGRQASPMELYDLREDPAEEHNLIGELPVWQGFLNSLLKNRRVFWPQARKAKKVELDETMLRNLEALGYVN